MRALRHHDGRRLARQARLLLLQHGMSVAVVAGFALGVLLARQWSARTQALLAQQVAATRGGFVTDGGGGGGGKPVRTRHGFMMVVHDFSSSSSGAAAELPEATAAAGSGSSSSVIAPAAGGEGEGAAGGGGFSASAQALRAGGAAAAGQQPAAAASHHQQQQGQQQQQQYRHAFKRGGGPKRGESLFYSESAAAGVTPAERDRVAAALAARAAGLPGGSVHALMTGNGSPYQNMQARIMAATLRLVQAEGGGGGRALAGFTRVMHRATDDALCGELPTFRAYPLEPACDEWCEFPVKDRPNAVAQFLLAAEQHPEELVRGAWFLLLESDYVWMRPLALPGSAHDPAVRGLGFSYDYIDPAHPDAAGVVREMCGPACAGAAVKEVPRSGPAPVLLRPAELARAAPDWEALTAWIERSDEAKRVLGWVREMYAWSVAVHRSGVKLTHEAPPLSRLMAQPPHDAGQGAAALLHYTWGSLLHDAATNKEVWRFDKRDWTGREHALRVPQFALPPAPWREGLWKLQDGVPVTAELHATLTAMLARMNRASATLPALADTAAAAA